MALQMFRTPKSTFTDGALNLASACSLVHSVSTGVLVCALLAIHGVPYRGCHVGWKIPRVRMVSLSLREHGGSSGCIRTRCSISEATRSSCDGRKGGEKPENWGCQGRGGLHGHKVQNSSNGQLPIGERGINGVPVLRISPSTHRLISTLDGCGEAKLQLGQTAQLG